MGAFADATERTNRFESFIEDRIKYRSLRPQFGVALLAGVGLSAGLAGIYSLMYPTEAEPIYGGLLFVLMFCYVLLPIVFWFVVSAIAFLAARLLGARADFGTLYRATGWGFVPFVGTTTFLSVGRYVALSNAYSNVCTSPHVVCQFAASVSIGKQANQLFALSGSVANDPVFIACFVLAALFYVVTVYLVAVAADEASTLTRAGGLVVVGVPMLLVGAVYTVNTFF